MYVGGGAGNEDSVPSSGWSSKVVSMGKGKPMAGQVPLPAGSAMDRRRQGGRAPPANLHAPL